MVLNMYCLKDEVLGDFGSIILQQNDGVAMRALKNAVNVQDSIYKTSPYDFTLYCLGKFDTTDASFTHNLTPERICSVYDLLEER